MEHVKSFDLFGVPVKQIPSITGSGEPTVDTEGAVGCLYMDTDTGSLYKCTSIINGIYTWLPVENNVIVKTVNGISPDKEGNIEIDTDAGSVSDEQIEQAVSDYMAENPAGGVTSWNDLTDKPFGDEKVYYEWNRNTEYTDVAPLYDGTEVAGYIVKLSDDTPDPDFFIGKYWKAGMGETEQVVLITEKVMMIGDDLYFIADSFIVSLKTQEIVSGELRGTLTPGVWCPDFNEMPFIYSVKVFDPGKPIPENLIPDTIARVSGVESMLSWNNITDKPFQSGAVYEYDENNTYANEDTIIAPVGGFFENSGTENGGPPRYIRVSNDGIPMDRLIGSHLSLTSRDGSRDSEATITEDLLIEITEDVYRIGDYIVVVNADEYYNTGETFTKGVYFGAGSNYYSYPFIRVCISVPAIVLADDVIPDTIARISDVQAMIDAAGGGSGGLSRDEVQAMIDEALGVIENGTY